MLAKTKLLILPQSQIWLEIYRCVVFKSLFLQYKQHKSEGFILRIKLEQSREQAHLCHANWSIHLLLAVLACLQVSELELFPEAQNQSGQQKQ